MRQLIIGFILGAGVGSGITYLIMKREYTRQMQEEMNKVDQDAYNRARAYFENKEIEESEAKAAKAEKMYSKDAEKALIDYRGESSDEEDLAEAESPSEYDEDDPEDMMNKEYNDVVEQTEIEENIQEALEKSRPKVKVLTPEHFGEIAGYQCETLKFYAHDKILIHEDGELVEDVEFLLGDALDRYGWADDDSDEDPLYARNYALQRDYDVEKILDEWHGNE
jgi:hypothetical protein